MAAARFPDVSEKEMNKMEENAVALTNTLVIIILK